MPDLRRRVIAPITRIGPIWRRTPRRHFLMSQHRRLGRRPFSFKRRGFRWTGFPWDDGTTRSIYVHDDYRPDLRRALVRWLREHGYLGGERRQVVEVGANIGTDSLALARDDGCRVLAIEPEPANFDLLERNVQANGLQDRIRCVCAAVAPASGQAEMVIPAGNSGAVELTGSAGRSSGEVQADGLRGRALVRTAPLETLLGDCGIEPSAVAFVWSDAQGADGHVIATAPKLWAAGVPLFMELWPNGLRHQGAEAAVRGAASRGFGSFIEVPEPVGDEVPPPRPIAELPQLMDSLVGLPSGPDQTDVLLIPENGWPERRA